MEKMEIQKPQITTRTFPPLKNRFNEKYRIGLEIVAGISVSKRKKEHSDWTLTQALADILKDANPDMPPSFVAEFVQHIIVAWENYGIEQSEIMIAEAA
jgi:hypothetical protein